MTKTVSAYEARTRLGELMNEVYYNNIEVIIERMGKPTVKIVPYNDLKKKRTVDRKRDFMEFAGMWAGEEGKIIEKYAKKFRKEFTLLPRRRKK